MMFSGCSDFKDLQFDNLQEIHNQGEDSKFSYPYHFQEKCPNEPTAQCQAESLQDFFMSRSIPIKNRNYQISFQSNLLDQHKIALKLELKNFIEQSFKFQKNRSPQKQQEDFCYLKIQEFLDEEEKHDEIQFQRKHQTLTLIEGHQNLNQFIEHMQTMLCKSVVCEHIYLFSKVYQRYEAQKQKLLSKEQIVQMCQQVSVDILEEIYESKNIKNINLRNALREQLNSQEEVKKALKGYLQFFLTTIMLIYQQYFENPFVELSVKRERQFNLESDYSQNESLATEEIGLGAPRKKIH